MSVTPYQPKHFHRHRTTRSNKIERFPQASRRLPTELRSLKAFQQIFSVLSFALVASALGVYAWSVYIPRIWSQEYKKLETLQRHERHLTAISESLKNELAQQAERPEMGLANPLPAQMVFLSPSSVKLSDKTAKTTSAENKTLISKTPLAY